MKKTRVLIKATIGMFVLIVIASLGPLWPHWWRPQIIQIDQPERVTDFLQQQKELNLPIGPGNEAMALWQSAPNTKTEYSLLYLHGFSASRREISPVVEDLSQTLKANAYFNRFPGHGELLHLEPPNLSTLTAQDLFQEAENAYAIAKKMGEHTIIVGTSTGASLAMWLGLRHPEIAALVLLSPNFGLKDPRAFLAMGPLGSLITRMVIGPVREWTPKFSAQNPFWTTRYSSQALRAVMDTVGVLHQMEMGSLRVPVFFVWNPKDEVISLSAIAEVSAQVPKELQKKLAVEAQDHVLAGAITSPATTLLVESEILNFLSERGISGPKGP